jgi:hypothetical protein
MRTGLLVTLALTCLAAAGPCIPILVNHHVPAAGELLGISVSANGLGQTLPEGTPVDITWSAANLTGDPATVSIILESRSDLSRTALAAAIPLDQESSGEQHVAWDTNGASGPFSIVAEIETAILFRDDASRGLITINARPKFAFTEPISDVVFQSGAGQTLHIAWVGSDETATVRIGLDPDTDHSSGNELTILERALPTTFSADSFDWDGTDTSAVAVPAGTYFLFGTATDDLNPVLTVDALGRITVE